MSVDVQTTSGPSADVAAPRSRLSAFTSGSLRANATLVIGGLIFIGVLILAIAGPWLSPYDPLEMLAEPLLWPGNDPEFLLGTDSLGRDVLSGVISGARVSVLVGLSAAIVGLSVGVFVGALSGFFGGMIDTICLRLMELFQTVPSFLLVIVIVVIGGPSVWLIALAIGLASWPIIARLVRAEFRSKRNAEFVLSARVLGYSTPRLIFSEILPNTIAPVIVTISVLVANAILTEAALSFLGLGDPNVVSWGTMIRDGRLFLRSEWFLSAIPGIAISLTVLSLNLLGDGLNNFLNPRRSNS